MASARVRRNQPGHLELQHPPLKFKIQWSAMQLRSRCRETKVVETDAAKVMEWCDGVGMFG